MPQQAGQRDPQGLVLPAGEPGRGRVQVPHAGAGGHTGQAVHRAGKVQHRHQRLRRFRGE